MRPIVRYKHCNCGLSTSLSLSKLLFNVAPSHGSSSPAFAALLSLSKAQFRQLCLGWGNRRAAG